MIARAVRRVTVSTTGTNIREANARPVTKSVLYYPTGGGTIEIGPDSGMTFGQGLALTAGEHFTLEDQALQFYAVASAGTVELQVLDYEA